MSKEKMSPIELHYMGLSEIYLAHYQNMAEPNWKIMQAMGVIVEMESDLVMFEKEKGVTDKSKKQLERIQVIKNAVDAFSIASDRCIQFNLILTKMYTKEHLKDAKIAELESEIIKLNKQLEGI